MADIFDDIHAGSTQPGGDVFDQIHASRPDQGFMSGLAQSLNPLPAIKELVLGTNPENGKYGGPIQGISNLATAAIQAQIDQGHKAAAAWRNGERTEALGHAMAAALPLLGPAAANAGEAIGEGRTGEGLGQAVGLIGSVLAPGAAGAVARTAPRLVGKVAPGAEDLLRASAEKDYARALNPTTIGNKLRTQEIVPELIDRGVTAGSLKGLQGITQRHIQSLGASIEDAWQNLPAGSTTDFDPIYSRLQNTIDTVHSSPDANGVLKPNGPEAERAIGNIESLQQVLMDRAAPDPTTGKLVVPSEKLRSLRQYFDNVAADAGRYDGKNLADQSTAEAHGQAADAIRKELGKDYPDIAALNKEFHFWADVNKVVSATINRRQGQAVPLGQKMATVGGFVKGGPVGAEAMSLLMKAIQSPAWKTTSAVFKDRLADAIAGNSPGAVTFYAQKLAQGAGAAAISGHEQQTPALALGPGR